MNGEWSSQNTRKYSNFIQCASFLAIEVNSNQNRNQPRHNDENNQTNHCIAN